MLLKREIVLIDENVKPDPEVNESIQNYARDFNQKLDQVCGYTGV